MESPTSERGRRTALVTGGTGGIGTALCKAFLARGMNVVASGSCDETIRMATRNYDSATFERLMFKTLDVREERSVKLFFEHAIERFGVLDIVVANAGLFYEGSVEKMPPESFERLLSVNVKGTFLVTRESLPYLKRRQGRLVFVASANALAPSPRVAVYAATKSWIRSFALSIQGEIAQDGISVTVLNCSRVNTPMGKNQRLAVGADAELLTPGEVAEVICNACEHQGTGIVQEVSLLRRGKWA